jgi:hypothetical protein
LVDLRSERRIVISYQAKRSVLAIGWGERPLHPLP